MDLDTAKAGFARDPRDHAEARDQIADLLVGERLRLAELPARQPEPDGRGCLWPGVDAGLRLAAGVAYLHPQAGAAACRRPRPAFERTACGAVGFAFKDDIAGPFEMAGINLDIAGEQHATAAVRPTAIEAIEFGGGPAVCRRQPFGHRGFRQPVGQDRAAGQRQRLKKAHSASAQTLRYCVRSATLSIFSVPRRGSGDAECQIFWGTLNAAIFSLKKPSSV